MILIYTDMKRIKKFNLFFESIDTKTKIDELINILDDIISIEYILDENQSSLKIDFTYDKCIFLYNNERSVYLRKNYSVDILKSRITDKDILSGQLDLYINLNRNMRWTQKRMENFDRVAKKYFNLLKEHLDYIEDDKFSFRMTIPGNYKISISTKDI